MPAYSRFLWFFLWGLADNSAVTSAIILRETAVTTFTDLTRLEPCLFCPVLALLCSLLGSDVEAALNAFSCLSSSSLRGFSRWPLEVEHGH